MAIKISRDTSVGIFLEESYLKIENVSGNKEQQNITLCTYASETAYSLGKSAVEQIFYTFTPSVVDGSPNFIKQGYEYLKTLTEFAEAIDA